MDRPQAFIVGALTVEDGGVVMRYAGLFSEERPSFTYSRGGLPLQVTLMIGFGQSYADGIEDLRNQIQYMKERQTGVVEMLRKTMTGRDDAERLWLT